MIGGSNISSEELKYQETTKSHLIRDHVQDHLCRFYISAMELIDGFHF